MPSGNLSPRTAASVYTLFRKILFVSVKFVSAILGPGNGCANFMDTWKKCVLSAGKTMSVKFPFFGGGGFGGGGGGSADFICMGARIFLKIYIL